MTKDMATVMDTMLNSTTLRSTSLKQSGKTKSASYVVGAVVLKLSVISLAFPVVADVKFTPTLALSTYAYQVEVADSGTDEGIAQSVTPGLILTYTNPWLKSSFSVDQMALFYKDAQRKNSTYTNYRLSNTASFMNDQLAFQLGSNQSYRSTGSQLSSYIDEVTNSGNMAKVINNNAGMSYNNQKIEWLNTNVKLNASETRTDQVFEPLFDNQNLLNQDLNVQQLVGSLEVKSADRNRKFFWGMEADASKTGRKQSEDLYNRRGYAVIGVPFFWRVSMIGQGSFESNSQLTNINSLFSNYRNYHSLGGGLEWKITDRSWWNVTYNTVNEQDGRREYIGTRFSLQPSRRTKLTGSFDRRFFGRSAEVTGSYKLQHLTMQVTVSDSVNSLLGLNGDNAEYGSFVCPPGLPPGLANCYQPPTAQYRPQPGETFYDILLPGQELSEQVVVRRNVNYTLGYAFSRLKLQVQLGQRRDIYLEQNAQVDDQYINATTSWQMSQRNSLALSSSYSKMDYQLDSSLPGIGQRKGTQASNTVTFNRQINPDLTGALSLRRVDVNYEGVSLDYKESRVHFDLNFKF
ncbi:MAG: hypothetical protein KKG89_24690 [Alphaproteobacteria bacterium]|nr:hypothetical protein [Alphaproteobacteria bacterium]